MTDRIESTASRLLHRELVLLVTLAAGAVAAFFLTRSLAESNARMHQRDASVWYERGRAALAEGDPTAAIAALRRSARLNPRSRDTVFALAAAFAAAHDDA